MDPQMVWDAMDECELEAEKKAASDKASDSTNNASKEDAPSKKKSTYGFGYSGIFAPKK